MKTIKSKNTMFLVIGIWFLFVGFMGVVVLPIPSINFLLSILAITSGIMIVVAK
jgi:lauroyl/myristoyl acyltransferase